MSGPDLAHAVWRKSRRSNGDGNVCLEVAFLPDAAAIRDSKQPSGGVLVLPPAGWRQFRESALHRS